MKKTFLILFFLFALFLRLYKLPELTVFNAEIAQNYLRIKSLLENPILLQGPNTSHDWLQLSSTPYYLFFPVMVVTSFHPLAGAYIWALISALTVILNYFVIRKIFNIHAAWISSILLAVSPSFISLGRLPHFYNYVIPLTYLFLWWIHKYIIGETKKLWLLFFIVGLAINFHFSAIILLPVVIIFILYRHCEPREARRSNLLKEFRRLLRPRSLHKDEIVKCILAFLLPNIPFLINETLHGFSMSKTLFLWFPYKIMNFLKGETYGLSKAPVQDNTLQSILEFFKNTLFPPDFPRWLGFIIISIILISFLIPQIRKKYGFRILFLWLVIGVTSLFIHKNPPFHYFMPIYILPIILISHIISVIASPLSGRSNLLIRITPHILISSYPHILISSYLIIFLSFLFSFRYFYQPIKPVPPYIPFKTQLHLARTIIDDARGQKYSLQRIGPFDNYENQFKDNYQYLLWWLGNEPVEKSRQGYIIVEEEKSLSNHNLHKVGEIDGIIITKEK